jgi:hypothetical protein
MMDMNRDCVDKLTYVLDHVSVLMKTILGQAVVLQVHTQLHVLAHDILVDLGPLLALGGRHHVVQLLQSELLFLVGIGASGTGNELVHAGKHILRLLRCIILSKHDYIRLTLIGSGE